jgi:hypothetical protein
LTIAQTNKILEKKDIENARNAIGNISLPIIKGFEFKDKGGVYNLFFCENQNEISTKDTLSTRIEAFCYLKDHEKYIEKWRISDFLDKSPDISGSPEISIWFWTRYTSNTDIDKDGFVDPVVVYGTKTDNGYRRIKIIVLYKGGKYVIRAEECDLDLCRTFKKDNGFSKLPKDIQRYIDSLLEKMRKEQGLILKNG